jgi:hypothetical protein
MLVEVAARSGRTVLAGIGAGTTAAGDGEGRRRRRSGAFWSDSWRVRAVEGGAVLLDSLVELGAVCNDGAAARSGGGERSACRKIARGETAARG